jgi:hypothetical protein
MLEQSPGVTAIDPFEEQLVPASAVTELVAALGWDGSQEERERVRELVVCFVCGHRRRGPSRVTEEMKRVARGFIRWFDKGAPLLESDVAPSLIGGRDDLAALREMQDRMRRTCDLMVRHLKVVESHKCQRRMMLDQAVELFRELGGVGDYSPFVRIVTGLSGESFTANDIRKAMGRSKRKDRD